MKKFAVMVFALLMILSTTTFAKEVTVTGTGATQSDAENDALRAAVENTLGIIIDSETNVNLANYSNGRAVFRISYGGSPQTFFNELCAKTPPI